MRFSIAMFDYQMVFCQDIKHPPEAMVNVGYKNTRLGPHRWCLIKPFGQRSFWLDAFASFPTAVSGHGFLAASRQRE